MVDGVAQRTQRPVTEVAPGEVELEVVFTPPPGQKLDERYGPATRLVVSATPPALLREGEGRGERADPAAGARPARRRRRPARGRDGGVLRRRDATVEFPACHVHQQDWGVPVRLVEGAPAQLALYLAG